MTTLSKDAGTTTYGNYGLSSLIANSQIGDIFDIKVTGEE